MASASLGNRLWDQANAIGMVSKIAGWYISFYADDLTEMLLDDMLYDTALELNDIEDKCNKVYVGEETKKLAEDALCMLTAFQNEAHMVSSKWEADPVMNSATSRTKA